MSQSRSLHGLDWLNFFVANVQTGFGPFIALYLTENRWTTAEVGFALTIGTTCSLVSQIPAGAIVDALRDKRRAVWVGILSISGTALMYALSPTQISVYLAEVLHGLASSVIGPSNRRRHDDPGRTGCLQRANRTQRAFRSDWQRSGGWRNGSCGLTHLRKLCILAYRRTLRAGDRRLAHDQSRDRRRHIEGGRNRR